jgi:integrase
MALDGKELPPARGTMYLGEASEITKPQAKSKLRSFLQARSGSDGTPRIALSLKSFIEGDFDNYLQKKAPITRRVHMNLLNNHILNTNLAAFELTDLTLQDCQDLIDVEIKKFEGGKLSWDTVKNILKVFSSVLGYAVKREILKANPAKYVTLPQKPVKQWVLAKPEKIDELIRQLPIQRATMVRLLASTGMRPGEMQALQLWCLDREKKTLRICATWDEDAPAGMRYKSTKTSYSDRTIGLNDADIEWLDKYLASRKDALGPNDYIFANREGGEPVRQNETMRRILKPAAVQLEMPFFDWYYLRHWSCSYQAANGTPLDVLHERLGHRDLRTTLKYYLHIPDERARAAAQVAGKMLNVRFDEVLGKA